MEKSEKIKLKILEQKESILTMVIKEIQTAITNNEEVRYIKDIEYIGTQMTFKLTKQNWVFSLDKARSFSESIEDYDKCKICRDLIKQLNNG